MSIRLQSGAGSCKEQPICGIWNIDLSRNVGESITDSQYDDAMERLLIYKRWLLDTLFKPDKQLTVMILPIAEAVPNYRDTPPGFVE